jgi:acyl-CoA synthetase (AMP-forming)/AMP-acid ligase II
MNIQSTLLHLSPPEELNHLRPANSPSSKVERVIYEMPEVDEVAVVGLPDKRSGETPVVVPHNPSGKVMRTSVAPITEQAGMAQDKFENHFEKRQEMLDQLLPKIGQDMVRFVRERTGTAGT